MSPSDSRDGESGSALVAVGSRWAPRSLAKLVTDHSRSWVLGCEPSGEISVILPLAVRKEEMCVDP
jgi:hypothetical protein